MNHPTEARVVVGSSIEKYAANALAEAATRLHKDATLSARQSAEVVERLDLGRAPNMVYGQTVTNLIAAQAHFEEAMKLAHHVMQSADVERAVSDQHVHFVLADD